MSFFVIIKCYKIYAMELLFMKSEDNNIEYKSTLTNKLKREIVAFLNTDGGKIYLGVDDETRKTLPVSDKEKHEWEETLNHWYTNAFYPTPFSLIEIDINHEPFLIKVKEGRHKPYSIAQNGLDSSGVYIRYGSSSVKATNEQVKRMIQQNSGNDEFDSEESKRQNLTFVKLKDRARQKKSKFSPKALRMLNNSHLYNNAALLVSDQNPYVVKAAVYQGTTVMEFRDKQEFTGALNVQIDDLLNYISLNNRTKVWFTGAPQREERKDYPDEAIREAVVNAFAHRDYLLHSFIKVQFFDNRMEILSPGGIPDGLTLAEIKDGMTAVRNPQLVHILDKMNYIENYGTAIDRMIKAYEGTGAQPEFKVTPHMFKVTFPNLNYQSKRKIKPEKVEATLSDADRIILLLKEKGAISKAEIQKVLNLSDYSSRKLLLELRKEDKVEKLGGSFNTKYKLK